MRKLALLVAVALLVVGFAWCVWPTPYRFYQLSGQLLRVNRLTGAVWLVEANGWTELRPPDPPGERPTRQEMLDELRGRR